MFCNLYYHLHAQYLEDQYCSRLIYEQRQFFFIPLNTNFAFYHLYVKTKLAAPVKRSDSEAITSFLWFP